MQGTIALFLSFGVVSVPVFAASTKSDKEIIQILIKESIANYDGVCPCPYNTMRNGNLCGNFSAYVKPGGAEPLCYAKDVTSEMINQYRNR